MCPHIWPSSTTARVPGLDFPTSTTATDIADIASVLLLSFTIGFVRVFCAAFGLSLIGAHGIGSLTYSVHALEFEIIEKVPKWH